MANPIYQINDLKHVYGNQPVLQINRLDIIQGSIIGLVGPNGSGKSTLLRILGLIERPFQGRLVYNGLPVEPFSHHARFQITLLPQEPFLMKRSVFNNVAYGLKMRGEKGSYTLAVKKALMMVGLSFDDFAHRSWYALSGGEAQRVALAARLVLEPKVLLMDEPTASIDAASAQLIREAAFAAKKEWGATLVVASHDKPWVNEVCDDVLTLFKGRLMDSDQENIIFGPWRDLGNGTKGKRLAGGQEIRVSNPPHPDAAAMMEVFLADDKAPVKAQEVLSGTICRLNLERNTGQSHITVIVGNLSLSLKVSSKQLQEKGLFPGKTVSIQYNTNSIVWR